MATHSSILAWRIPWTEKPGGLLRVLKSQAQLKQLSMHAYTYIPHLKKNSCREFLSMNESCYVQVFIHSLNKYFLST